MGDAERRWGPAADGDVTSNQCTIIHEWGHQVGYDAFAYWGLDYAMTEADMTGVLRRALGRMDNKTLDRLNIAESRDDIDFAVTMYEDLSPVERLPGLLAEQRGELAAWIKLEELADEAGIDDWRAWADANLSGYAPTNPHEFAAEAFTAVTLYGDDAPLLARRLVGEMEAAQDAMDAETAAALLAAT